MKQYFDALGNEVTSEVAELVGEKEKLKKKVLELEESLKTERRRKVRANG